MSMSEFKQGSAICSEGEPLREISLIIKGNAETSFCGRPFRLEKGDMIGLCGLGTNSHNQTYIATSDVTVLSYTYDGFNTLESLSRASADTANLLVNSMCRQISNFLQYLTALKQQADGAYESVQEIYPEYERLCKLYALTSKKLPGLMDITRFSGSDTIEGWLHDYYLGINFLGLAARKGFFYGNPGICLGFLRKSAEDIVQVLQACKVYQEYLEKISKYFLEDGGHDLFTLLSELHFKSINIKGADAAVEGLMVKLTDLMNGLTGIDPAVYQNRLDTYKQELGVKRASLEITDAPAASGPKQNLSDSLDIILTYAECPEETCNKFISLVKEYTELPDRTESDDVSRRLRKNLTELFLMIYENVLIKSLEDPAVSTVIKMFLNFGYVDAGLAGHDNADFLYSIADSLKGRPDIGIYTAREWLAAIYNGKKEPNRNEFDVDYNEYLRDLKQQGKIDAKEEERLLSDPKGKLRFEMENVFPTVNKITYGRITTYCPLFADHNVQRNLDLSLVKPLLLKEILEEIRGIDFSAYCREILYSNPKCGITNEFLHVEVLPDFILMPNAGIRGAMWQEIEGRKRNTAARMFLPVFLEGDLKNLIIRLTGEFRWEMCKRVQGVRWNDITNPSLTSEFSDFLQFYKNNRSLSPEVKEDIKTDLARARNNYKSYFVACYIEWLLYESNGAPRLNKMVLGMMLTYCTFSASVREKLKQFPRYTELLNRRDIKHQQIIQRLSNVMQKAHRTGNETPQELLNEMEFLKS